MLVRKEGTFDAAFRLLFAVKAKTDGSGFEKELEMLLGVYVTPELRVMPDCQPAIVEFIVLISEIIVWINEEAEDLNEAIEFPESIRD